MRIKKLPKIKKTKKIYKINKLHVRTLVVKELEKRKRNKTQKPKKSTDPKIMHIVLHQNPTFKDYFANRPPAFMSEMKEDTKNPVDDITKIVDLIVRNKKSETTPKDISDNNIIDIINDVVGKDVEKSEKAYKKLSDLVPAIKEVNDNIKHDRAELERSQKNLDEINFENNRLGKIMEKMRNENDILSRDNEHKNALNKELDDKYNKTKNEFKQLETYMLMREKVISKNESIIKRYDKELIDMQKEIDEHSKDRNMTRKELYKMKTERNKLNAKISEMEEENKKLNNEIQTSEIKLKRIKEEITESDNEYKRLSDIPPKEKKDSSTQTNKSYIMSKNNEDDPDIKLNKKIDEAKNLSNVTASNLKEFLRYNRIGGYSKLNKDGLLKLMFENDFTLKNYARWIKQKEINKIKEESEEKEEKVKKEEKNDDDDDNNVTRKRPRRDIFVKTFAHEAKEEKTRRDSKK